MAGDWIKMRKSIPTDGRVIRMMSALNADRLRTIGGLLSAWCLLDEHTETGKLDGYTAAAFDEVIGFPGLATAMQSVGWLEIGDGYLQAPDFERHNGSTAKRRAQESVRKMSARNADKCPQVMQTKSAPEKRIEEKRTEVKEDAPLILFSDPPKPNKSKPMNLEEVFEYADKQGIKHGEAEDFWDKMEAGGWKRGTAKIADWQAHMRTYSRNGWLKDKPKASTRTFTKS